MIFMCVNLWAVLGAAAATMVIGFLWYSPFLFGRPWMVLMGNDPNHKAKIAEMQKKAGPLYGISMLASLLAALVLGKIIHHLAIATWPHGMKVGFAVWGGCGDGAVDRFALRQAPVQVVCDQYGIPVCLLPRDGSDPRAVDGVLRQR